jgi:primosomal protein N' (replication factor Y)
MFASVVIDAVIGADSKVFDYQIPDGMTVSAGFRVVVPFGKRAAEGFVLAVNEVTAVDEKILKPITRAADDFVAVKPEFLNLLPEICDFFKLRYIDVLRLFIPSVMRGKMKAKKNGQKRIPAGYDKEDAKVILTNEQQTCVKEILNGQGVFVLHGVTGSGKTEVYMNVIEEVLRSKKTALMLVPEIGLTPQVLANFRARFGGSVAMLHSGLSAGERYDEWRRIHSGEANIVIGARSGVFAPLENIGVIIIDEEHDSSYQSDSNPRYCTHDIAIMRAGYNKCPVVLGSATPGIETFYKTKSREYKLLTLSQRVGGGRLPPIVLVDMCAEIRSGSGGIFSRLVMEELFEKLNAGRSVMVFLNRRGYSQSIRCSSCGWVAKCENCDISLVYHRDEEQLKCHYCDARFTTVTRCPACGSPHLNYGAMGTQKVVAELEKILTNGGLNVPIIRMDADNTKTKGSLLAILNKFANTTPSVLVGTQMIAKGHHFPNVDMVAVLDADNSLHVADYRSAERTFALLTQVAGRAGRAKTDAAVYIQTYMPKHYVYKFVQSYDYNNFYEREINSREVTKYPPFSQIVRVLVSGSVDVKIKTVLEKIMKKLRTLPNEPFIFLGAMKCPHGRLQNKFRYQVLARIKKDQSEETINCICGAVKSVQQECPSSNLQIFTEINPSSLA